MGCHAPILMTGPVAAQRPLPHRMSSLLVLSGKNIRCSKHTCVALVRLVCYNHRTVQCNYIMYATIPVTTHGTHMTPRRLFLLLVSVSTVFIVAALYCLPPAHVWSWWNIPVMQPTFADLYVVTSGAESCAHGFDPLVNNPFDPEQRRLNYPRVWQWLGGLGVRTTHTVPLGVLLAALFLGAVFLAVPTPSWSSALMAWCCLIAPAPLFAIERGNADLFIFFLLAIAIVVARQWLLSLTVIMAAFILKLYPLAALALCVRYPPRRAIVCWLLAMCVALAYLFAIRHDLALISSATPRGASQSYGLNVFWTQLATVHVQAGVVVRYLSWAAAALIVSAGVYLARARALLQLTPCIQLDAFRAGAAVYCGTFLLGNNWDYRLIFLLFAVPQCVTWLHCRDVFIRRLAQLATAAVLLSFWHFLIARTLRPLPYGVYISSTLDELANWLLFACLVWLLSASLPAWIQQLLKFDMRPIHSCADDCTNATVPAT